MTKEEKSKKYQKLLDEAENLDAPVYQRILVAAGIVSMLKKEDFQDDHEETVLRRLVGALSVILDGLTTGRKDEFSNSRLYGINQCLHLASSVALLVGDDNLAKGRKYVHSQGLVSRTDTDAETLITVATLQILLKMAALIPKDKLPFEVSQKLERIASRVPKTHFPKTGWADCLEDYLAQANWVIGEKGVKELKLYRLPRRAPSVTRRS